MDMNQTWRPSLLASFMRNPPLSLVQPCSACKRAAMPCSPCQTAVRHCCSGALVLDERLSGWISATEAGQRRRQSCQTRGNWLGLAQIERFAPFARRWARQKRPNPCMKASCSTHSKWSHRLPVAVCCSCKRRRVRFPAFRCHIRISTARFRRHHAGKTETQSKVILQRVLLLLTKMSVTPLFTPTSFHAHV